MDISSEADALIRKIMEMTTVSSIAPATVSPMAVKLPRKKIMDKPQLKKKKLTVVREDEAYRQRIDRVIDLIAGSGCKVKEAVVQTRPLGDQIQLQEPTRKPSVLPPPRRSLFRSLLNKIPAFDTPAPAVPFKPDAIDRIKLVEPTRKPDNEYRMRIGSTAIPSNPMSGPKGTPVTQLKPKWKRDKRFGVVLPDKGHPLLHGAKIKKDKSSTDYLKKNPWLSKSKKPHGNSARMKRVHPDYHKPIPAMDLDGLLPDPALA